MTGELLAEIGRNVAILGTILGLLAVSIKVGQWKGENETNTKHSNARINKMETQMESMDKRLDRLDRELAGTLTSLQKDVEYIKKSLDEFRQDERRHGTKKYD